MTVTISGNPVYGLNGLSDEARRVLRLIDGGVEWLHWASRDGTSKYHFEQDEALVAAVQPGLHGSPLMLLPRLGLLVGPAKLMSLSPDELAAIERYEGGDTTQPSRARIRRILAQRGLATQSDLLSGTTFLRELFGDIDAGAPLPPVFQAMGLNDQIAIYDLSGEPVPGDLPPAFRNEAALFAVGAARTPLEFADYYRVYLQYVATSGTLSQSSADRAASVQAILDSLLPVLFAALDCPRIEPPAHREEVALALTDWFRMQRWLGFARLSAGVRQLVSNGGFGRGRKWDDPEQAVAAYLEGARALLADAKLGATDLCQDGVSRTWRVVGDDHQAVVAAGVDGIVTLASYGPLPPAKSAPPPPPPPAPSAAVPPAAPSGGAQTASQPQKEKK